MMGHALTSLHLEAFYCLLVIAVTRIEKVWVEHRWHALMWQAQVLWFLARIQA